MATPASPTRDGSQSSDSSENRADGATLRESTSGDTPERAPAFSKEEDSHLLAHGIIYQTTIQRKSVAERINFWMQVREDFGAHHFEQRGVPLIHHDKDSPYFRRWYHIYSSYKNILNLMLSNGAPRPRNNADIDKMLAQATAQFELRRKKGGKKAGIGVPHMGIGLQHFRELFFATEGFTPEDAAEQDVAPMPVHHSASTDLNDTNLLLRAIFRQNQRCIHELAELRRMLQEKKESFALGTEIVAAATELNKTTDPTVRVLLLNLLGSYQATLTEHIAKRARTS